MNRRVFITTTSLALTYINLLGATIPTKTYRSASSIFTNEELIWWCQKNGGHYVENNELVHAYYQKPNEIPNAFRNEYKSFRHLIFGIPTNSDKYEALNYWVMQYRFMHGQYKFILKDIYYPDYVINNVKMMPLIATRRELSNNHYRVTDPIFDLKTRKQLIPVFESEGGITIGFKEFRMI